MQCLRYKVLNLSEDEYQEFDKTKNCVQQLS